MRGEYIQRIQRIGAAAIFAGTILLAGHLPAAAEDSSENFTRSRKQDIYIIFQTINSKQLEYQTQSGLVPLSVDTTYLGGIGFGYHINNHLSWRFETTFGDTVMRGKGPAAGVNRNVWLNSGLLNFDWFLTRNRIAPFITGGFGWQYIEAQLSNNVVPVAYWDPWWGYSVTSTYPTYSETDFVWTAGLGVRWDVSDRFFLKLSADAIRVNYVNITGNPWQVKYGFTAGAVY